MPVLTLLLLLPVLACCRHLCHLRLCGHHSDALRLYRRLSLALGGGVWMGIAAQEALLLLAGPLTPATALPLHLCSITGLLTLPALLTRRDALLHILLYAGLPGAVLALLFPAVAQSPWPVSMAFFFCLTHGGIALAPLLPLCLGWRPRPRGAAQSFLFLLTAAIAASVANRMTGGNYLFLAGPVAGTPLTALSQWGMGAYRLLLVLLAALVMAAEAAVVFCLRRIGHCTARKG